MLAPRGLLTFTTFGPDTLRELRGAWLEVDAHTRVSQFIDMHDIGDALVRAGFAAPVLDVERYTLSYADVRGLTADLKAIGARNATTGRPRGLTSPRKFAAMRAAYEKYRSGGRLPATYEVVFGQAWAPVMSAARFRRYPCLAGRDEAPVAAAPGLLSTRLFITGTDTGVGKTRIATALCVAFAAAGKRVAAMKPVASGCEPTPDGLRNEDAMALHGAMTVRARYDEVNPYAFAPAVAPHIAAREAGIAIDVELLDRCYDRLALQSDVTLVEGAGGWLAPLDDRRNFADLAVRWQLDIVLVVGLRLGCLNHALLTAESIQRHGLRLAGWVGNAIDPAFERREENLTTLRSRLAAPCLGTFPYSVESEMTLAAKILSPSLRELEPIPRP